MEKSEQLFEAILQRDFTAADELISAGVTLDPVVREALVKGPSSAANFDLARYNHYKRFTLFAENASAEDFAAVAEKLFGLVGEPLYNTFGEYRYGAYKNVFFDPVFFEALLKYCNGKQMRKQMTMQEIIDRNNMELLEMCAKYGWLKMPRIRDAMIKYSEDKNKTECTAFLLDFKNRNFDLAAEREKAEKRMERELNANPNSVTELKKIWSFETQEDGSLIITSYRGKRTEVEVPSKIGKSAVTAVGAYAFAANASRLRHEQSQLRAKITKITLPDSIQTIGESAFSHCYALEQCNIPNGVSEIKPYTFCACTNLKEIVIPETVKAIREGAFSSCQKLTEIRLPEGIAEICDQMFRDCRALKSVRLPSTVEKIGKWAFRGCISQESIVIPEGVAEIGRLAFANCTQLKTVALPASLKSIKNYKLRDIPPQHIFHDSTNVTAVVEPKSYAEKYCNGNGIKYIYKENR